MIEINKILCGNTLKLLKDITDNSINKILQTYLAIVDQNQIKNQKRINMEDDLQTQQRHINRYWVKL